MAEEKKTPAKVEEGKMAKFVNFVKALPGRIAKPFKNMVAELRKVTWPSKKKLIASSVTVLLFMLFMGVVIGALDLASTTAMKALVGVTANADVDATTDTTADAMTDAAATETTDVPEATEAPAAE
ncbi:MAG: preprotein translocase subunit SecE [Clostridia bacterium]|nr:preprotein translocase subunit SecE [Clostridia bacterium]